MRDRLARRRRRWCSAARHVCEVGGVAPEDVRTLLLQGQQYQWGGRDCGEARALQQRLQEVQLWADQVREPETLCVLACLLQIWTLWLWRDVLCWLHRTACSVAAGVSVAARATHHEVLCAEVAYM